MEVIIPTNTRPWYTKPTETKAYLQLDKQTRDTTLLYYTTEGCVTSTVDYKNSDITSLTEEYNSIITKQYTQLLSYVDSKQHISQETYIQEFESSIFNIYKTYYSYPPCVLKSSNNLIAFEHELYVKCITVSNIKLVEFLIKNTDIDIPTDAISTCIQTTINNKNKSSVYKLDLKIFELLVSQEYVLERELSKQLFIIILRHDLVDFMNIILKTLDDNNIDIGEYIVFNDFIRNIHHISYNMYNTLLQDYYFVDRLVSQKMLLVSIENNKHEICKHIIEKYNAFGILYFFEDKVKDKEKKDIQNIVEVFYRYADKKEYHTFLLFFRESSVGKDELKYPKNIEDIKTIKDVINELKLLGVDYRKYVGYVPMQYKQYIIEFYGSEAIEYLMLFNIHMEEKYIDYLLDKFTYDDKVEFIDMLKKYNIKKDKSSISMILEDVVGHNIPASVFKNICEFRDE